jgi:hypothetical protein
VSASERMIVNLATWWMAITGAAFFFMKYLMSASDPFSVIHHPWQPHALSLHVIGGPIAVFALGLIVRDHIVDRLLDPRQRRGRSTGLVLIVLAPTMIASGYLLQVVTDPAVKRVLVGAHLISGGLYVLLFAGHLLVGRSLRRGANSTRAGGATSRARRSYDLDRPGRRGIKSLVRCRAVDRPAGREEMTP